MTEHNPSSYPDKEQSIEHMVQSIDANETPFMLTAEMFTAVQNLLLEHANTIQDRDSDESKDDDLETLRNKMSDLYELTEAIFEHIAHEESDETVAASSFTTFYVSEQENRIEFLSALYGSDEYRAYDVDNLYAMSLEAVHLYSNPREDKTYTDVLESIYKHDVDTNFNIFINQPPADDELSQLAAREVKHDERLERKEIIIDGAKSITKEIAKAAITGIAIGITLRISRG